MTTKIIAAAFAVALFLCASAAAQTTAFTYQGSLKDGASPANGNYDFEFALFDALSGGGQIGSTVTVNNVAVSGGIFSVKLDFGSVFPGTNRFLEIRVRLAGQPGITTLGPRQLLNSAPYSVKSLSTDNATNATTATNALQLGGIASNGFIQNGTSQQPSSNFNISGNGVFGGNVGIGTSAPQKTLHAVGQDIRIEGSSPSAIPRFSIVNTGGPAVGVANTGKWQNYAVYGALFGALRFTALNDAENQESIWLNVDRNPGIAIRRVQFPNGDVSVGNRLLVGTTAVDPSSTLDVRGNATIAGNAIITDTGNSGLRVQTNTVGGTVASFGGNGAFNIDTSGLVGGRLKVLENGNVGIGMPAGSNVNNKLDVVGTIGVWTLGSGGSVPLCWNTGGFNLSTCGSSLRYKKNQSPFTDGLKLLARLQPITFDWKESGVHDLGLGAEDVEKIEPLLVTYNAKGEVEGVKYDRIGVVLINAVKEQQEQIEKQQALIEQLEKRLEQLEKKEQE